MIKKVLITTAGIGSRAGSTLNKGLISIGGKPVLSHIIERFPLNVDFVISLGYGGDLIRQFLLLTYPERKFSFVEVSPFQGDGASPTHSILSCEHLLQCPFIFITNDTIVEGEIPLKEENWIGITNSYDLDISNYRTICTDESSIALLEKEPYPSSKCKPYIGLASIVDYKQFWNFMRVGDPNHGEANGLRGLISCCNVSCKYFDWYDTGNTSTLNKTRSAKKSPYTVLDKMGEAIWFTNRSVIKYNEDAEFIAKRIERNRSLSGFVPSITGSTKNLYKYELVDGDSLTTCITPKLFKKLLKHLDVFWRTPHNEKLKRGSVNRFIYGKVRGRLEEFLKARPSLEKIDCINGVNCNSAINLINRTALEYANYQAGWTVMAHGDLHLDNILWDGANFTLVDWRQGFENTLNAFDIHYELAKLYQSLLLSYKDILNNNYDVNVGAGTFSFSTSVELVLCQNILREYVGRRLDWRRVVAFTALIFLSNTALQLDEKYATLNYFLGRYMLENL